jgi:hypothetical protein
MGICASLVDKAIEALANSFASPELGTSELYQDEGSIATVSVMGPSVE